MKTSSINFSLPFCSDALLLFADSPSGIPTFCDEVLVSLEEALDVLEDEQENLSSYERMTSQECKDFIQEKANLDFFEVSEDTDESGNTIYIEC